MTFLRSSNVLKEYGFPRSAGDWHRLGLSSRITELFTRQLQGSGMGLGGLWENSEFNRASIFRESMPEQAITLDKQFDPEDEYRPEPEPEPVPAAWLEGSPRIRIHT